MYYAKIDDYYVNGDAIFYHLSEKLDMAPILQNRLNNSERQKKLLPDGALNNTGLQTGITQLASKGFIRTARLHSI